jgi:hypothetical protein
MPLLAIRRLFRDSWITIYITLQKEKDRTILYRNSLCLVTGAKLIVRRCFQFLLSDFFFVYRSFLRELVSVKISDTSTGGADGTKEG